MKTNEKKLVKISVAGEITHPVHTKEAYIVSADTGRLQSVPMVGGITYNVKIGDSAVDWEGDHVEPGVSIACCFKNEKGFSVETALTRFSCIGNEAIVQTGDAKGKKVAFTFL